LADGFNASVSGPRNQVKSKAIDNSNATGSGKTYQPTMCQIGQCCNTGKTQGTAAFFVWCDASEYDSSYA
jgi:hypothetical protein